jgi:hypothetical protein
MVSTGNAFFMMFSIIHPSARPDKWREAHDAWMGRCSDPSQVEYLLAVEERFELSQAVPVDVEAIWNHGRPCFVDAANAAAQASHGSILICIADDLFPPQDWDVLILKAIAARGASEHSEFVLEVATGTPDEHQRKILPLGIISRVRYLRTGDFFFPEYISMYSDNDLFEAAEKDGVLVECRHLTFEHRHPLFDPRAQMDPVYERQNRPEAYEVGERVLAARRANGFKNRTGLESVTPKRSPVVHLIMPGENFTGVVMMNNISIVTGLLQKGYAVVPHNFHCSNVYFARNVLAERALSISQGEFFVWLDDDQLVDVNQVVKLLKELEAHPEADVVGGWTWIQAHICGGDAKASCGIFNEDGFMRYIASFVIDGEPGLHEVEWTGFPLVAMRRSALEKIGRNPFAPMPTKNQEFGLGYYGEDAAFCLRLREKGGRIFIDPTVYVPHLKLREAVPESSAPVKTLQEQVL